MQLNLDRVREMANAIKSGEVAVSSPHGLVNEAKQTRKKAREIPYLKKEFNKWTKILFPLQLTFKFDPFTGSTEVYNEDNEYRIPASVTEGFAIIKTFANNSEELKRVLTSKVGIEPEEWDTTDVEAITDVDKLVLNRYRKLRPFTYPVVNVKLPGICNDTMYGKDIYLKVDRDEMGHVDFDSAPVLYKLSQLESAIARERYAELKEEIENDPEKAAWTKEAKSKYCSSAWDNALISSIQTRNVFKVIALPINKKKMIDNVDLSTLDMEATKALEYRFTPSKKLFDMIKGIINDEETDRDMNLDFVEIEMRCPGPAEGVSSEDKKEIGQNTNFIAVEDEKVTISKQSGFENFMDNYAQMLSVDQKEQEEEFIKASWLLSTPSEDKLIKCYKESFNVESPYITDKVIDRFGELISLVVGDEATLEKSLEATPSKADDVSDEEFKSEEKKANIIDLGVEEDDFDEDGVEKMEATVVTTTGIAEDDLDDIE